MNTSKTNTFYKTKIWAGAILIFLRTYPFFIWNQMASMPIFKTLLDFVIAFIFLSEFKRFKGREAFLFLLFIFATFLRAVSNEMSIVGFLAMSAFAFVAFCKNEYLYKTFISFQFIYAVIIGVSLVCWIFVLIGIMPSFGIIEHYSEDRTYDIYGFVIREHSILEKIRFAGVYYESGLLGTINAVLLCINKFRISDWKNVILLVSGLFTFSLYFYVIVLIAGFCFIIYNKNKIMPILFAFGFLLFYSYTKNEPIFEELVWDRLTWDSKTGKLAGDDRSIGGGAVGVDEFYEKIKWTRQFWWGVDDKQAYENMARGSCTYKNVVANSGMVFFLTYNLFFILFAFNYKLKNRDFIIYVLVLLSVMYQRPFEHDVFFIFIYSFYGRKPQIFRLLSAKT